MQQYLAIKTVHPEADYRQAINLFVNQAIKDQIEYLIIELDSGFPMLVLCVPGTDRSLPALLLNHHMDVVCADDAWSYPPFLGMVKDGYIYGRGVQDMKGVGVVHYASLRELKQDGISLKRSVYLTMVPGEEQGGFDGTGCFIATDFFKSMNIGYVLDEGVPSGIENTIIIATDERLPLQLRVCVKGQAAHASQLMHQNPIHTLLGFLTDINRFHEESVLKALNQDPGLYSSYHITSLTAGNDKAAINTIPAAAHAIIDIRVAPSDSVGAIIDSIDLQMKHYSDISYEILAVAREKKRIMNQFFLRNHLESVIVNQGYESKILVFEGASDMRFYRQLGIEAVGCSPFDDQPLLHAVDERVSLESLYKGRDIIKALVFQMCNKE